MKKIFALFISFVLAFSLCGCIDIDINFGKKSNEISEMYDNGYTCTMDTVIDDVWYGLLQKDDSYYKMTATLSKDDAEDYNELSAADDDYEEEREEFLFELKDVKKEDLTDKIPTELELMKYVGMTYGEFEEQGFENMGQNVSDNDTFFMFEGPIYSCDVTLDGDITDMDDWSQNDLRELNITDIKFTGFSQNILTNE